MINERNRSIDVVKGVLILLVVIGHVLVGPIDEHVLRYVIYSFHMPAFFFVSGYLLSLERLGQQNYGAMFSKYRKRMLMEWCIAWVIYMPYVLRDGGLSASVVLQNLRSPWYHLWFVPSLFVMVSLLWVLVRIVKNKEVRFVLLMGLGLLFYNLTNTDFAIGTTFDCRHLIFLAMGIYAHRLFTNIKASWGGNYCLHNNHDMPQHILQHRHQFLPYLHGGSVGGYAMPAGDTSVGPAGQVALQADRVLGTPIVAHIPMACYAHYRTEVAVSCKQDRLLCDFVRRLCSMAADNIHDK